jgi:hypothetical protein
MKIFCSQRLLLAFTFGVSLGLGTTRAAINWTGVTCGNGVFVAVGYNPDTSSDRVSVSSDGLRWTTQDLGSYSGLSSLTFGHGTFVAVGPHSVLTSTNGLDWRTWTWHGDPYILKILYGQDTFVAVGWGDAVLTSPDASVWSARRLGGSYWLSDVAYGSGQFVAVNGYGVLTSSNAVYWSLLATGDQLSFLSYGSGLFVASCYSYPSGYGLRTSPTGTNWTPMGAAVDMEVSRPYYANGRFFVFRPDGVVQTSTDALTWENWNCGLTSVSGLAFGVGRYVAAGNYGGIATSTDGKVWTSVDQRLSAPAISGQPLSQVVTAGDLVELTVQATGNPAPSHQWRFGGADLPALPANTLRLPNVFTNQAGSYSVVLSNSLGSVTSEVAVLTVQTMTPTFHLTPANLALLEGSSYSFYAEAESAPPASYQWQLNGRTLLDGMGSTLSLVDLSTNQAGTYTLVASNAVGMATGLVAVLTVQQRAPVIQNFWSAQVTNAGAMVEFCADVAAGPPAAFQWQHDGSNIPGATFACLSLQALPADAGLYTVVASNFLGSVTGAVATLTVNTYLPTTAVLRVLPATVVEGNRVVFSAQSAGAPPPELSLQINGTNLALPWEKTYLWSPTYLQQVSIPEATLNDAGDYTVLASNSIGSVTSQVATLTVTPAGPLDHWSRRNPRPQGYNLLSLAAGNGLCVAVGDRGAIVTSPNGTNWTVQPLRADVSLVDVTFGNGLFVAVGDGGTILTSAEGSHWTLRASGLTDRIGCVAYGNGRFVASGVALAGGTSVILTSADGMSWSRQYVPVWARDLAYGNGQFVAVGYDSQLWTSPDGTTWSAHALSNYYELESVAFLNGLFVAVGNNGYAFISGDGFGWIRRATSTSRRLLGVTYAFGKYIAVGTRGVIVSSPNTLDWTTETSGTPDRLEEVIAANDLLVALGENGTTLTSRDGATWVKQNLGTTLDLDGLVAGDNRVVVVGKSGAILTSTNGTDYPEQVSGTTANLHGVAFDHGLFLAVGEPGAILTSTNGRAWSSQSALSSSSLKRATYGNGLWVAVGTEGTILTSPEGTQWTQRNAGRFDDLNDVAFGNGQFIAVGDQSPPNGTLLASYDGVNWVDRSLPTGKNLRAVAFGNGHFMALGNDGVIAISTNGSSWSYRDSGLNYDGGNLRGLTYANGYWVVVGNDGIILTSTNTFDWSRRASRTLENLHGAAYFQNSFVTMGNRGNVLQSGGLVARLIPGTYDPNRGFAMVIRSGPDLQHRLQASPDLIHWTDLLTFKPSQDTTNFLDAEALLHRCRFYRLVSP